MKVLIFYALPIEGTPRTTNTSPFPHNNGMRSKLPID